MTKRFGFTLAEVLITLGIIGVVAAMTIPTLIANTNSAKFRAQFKKTVSTLNQAGLMAQAQYDFDYAGTDEACAANGKDNPEEKMTFCSLLNGTLTGATFVANLSTLKRANSGSTTADGIAYSFKKTYSAGVLNGKAVTDFYGYQLADGSIVGFPKGVKGCTLELGQTLADGLAGTLAGCIGFIDVNGTTLPNTEVSCGKTATENTAAKWNNNACTVKNDAKHMTDIFPVVFHDATVEGATNASRYVMTSSK